MFCIMRQEVVSPLDITELVLNSSIIWIQYQYGLQINTSDYWFKVKVLITLGLKQGTAQFTFKKIKANCVKLILWWIIC